MEANTTHKVLGIFGEEAVNVLGVNLAIAQSWASSVRSANNEVL